MKENKQYYIYILECSNGNYYSGYTTDLKRRYQEHASGSAKCKYTRSFPPIRLAAAWEISAGLSVVLKIEKAIKKLKRQEKIELIADPDFLYTKIDASDFISSEWSSISLSV